MCRSQPAQPAALAPGSGFLRSRGHPGLGLSIFLRDSRESAPGLSPEMPRGSGDRLRPGAGSPRRRHSRAMFRTAKALNAASGPLWRGGDQAAAAAVTSSQKKARELATTSTALCWEPRDEHERHGSRRPGRRETRPRGRPRRAEPGRGPSAVWDPKAPAKPLLPADAARAPGLCGAASSRPPGTGFSRPGPSRSACPTLAIPPVGPPKRPGGRSPSGGCP